MFGGAGIYRNGLMFALTVGDQVFLKSDAETQPLFRQAGCRPFLYEKAGRTVETSYWSVPDAALDEPDVMKVWAERAYEAACRKRSRRRVG